MQWIYCSGLVGGIRVVSWFSVVLFETFRARNSLIWKDLRQGWIVVKFQPGRNKETNAKSSLLNSYGNYQLGNRLVEGHKHTGLPMQVVSVTNWAKTTLHWSPNFIHCFNWTCKRGQKCAILNSAQKSSSFVQSTRWCATFRIWRSDNF